MPSTSTESKSTSQSSSSTDSTSENIQVQLKDSNLDVQRSMQENKNYFMELYDNAKEFILNFQDRFNINFAWLLLGGLPLALQLFFGAWLLSMSFFGLPLGVKAFQLAKHSLFCPGFQVVPSKSAGSFFNIIANSIWFLVIGWYSALMNSFFALFLGLFPFTKSLAQDHLKFLGFVLAPFGKDIIPLSLAPLDVANGVSQLIDSEMFIVDEKIQSSSSGFEKEFYSKIGTFSERSQGISNETEKIIRENLDKKAEKKYSIVRKAVSSAEEQVNTLKTDMVKMFKDTIQSLNHDVTIIKNQQQVLTQLNTRAQEDVKRLNIELDKYHNFEQKWMQEQQKNRQERSFLLSQVQDLQNKIQSQQFTNVSDLKDRVASFEIRTASILQERDDARRAMETIVKDRDMLNNRLATLSKELETTRLELDTAKAALAASQTEREQEKRISEQRQREKVTEQRSEFQEQKQTIPVQEVQPKISAV